MIRLRQEHLKQMRMHAESTYPHECCGLLLGKIVDGVKVLVEVLPVANLREEEAKRNRYLISSEERFRAELAARKRGLGVIGCYHSHPDAPAKPSEFDREHAPFPVESFMIVSVQDGISQKLTSWVLSDDRAVFHPEEIIEE